MLQITVCKNQEEWDDAVLEHGGHPLQLWGWGEVKAKHNWRTERVMLRDDGDTIVGLAQLQIRALPFPFRAMVYVSRGPLCHKEDRGLVLEALAEHAKSAHKAVVLTIEPDWEGEPLPYDGWRQSENTILIPHTLILDLSKSEDELLAAMNKKTRQYVRKSGREAVAVKQVKTHAELQKCLAIYKQTAERAGFGLHDDAYYFDVFDDLGQHSPVFAAYDETGDMLAFLWLAISETTAFELYGGMNDAGQKLRANYTLKWHAITTMKKWGIERYDFNGLLNDGVSTFKQGFASHETMLVGTYDRPLSPLYSLWSGLLPSVKKLVRKLKRR